MQYLLIPVGLDFDHMETPQNNIVQELFGIANLHTDDTDQS